jgi:Spy/CpxP family protein refolding chaperone
LSFRKFAAPAVCALALGAGISLFAGSAVAQDAEKTPTTKPAKPMKGPRLVQPWSKMESLTDEQKIQIADLHKKAVAEKKKIDEQEEADIKALLTDEQKVELQKLLEDTAVKRKAGPKKPEAETETPAGERKEGM